MPPLLENEVWSQRVRDTLSRYADPLIRDVVAKLVKPRTTLPADELVDRCFNTLLNPPGIDRRIKDLPDAARKTLTLIGLSRRPTWKVGHLIMMLASVGHTDGFGPILTLLEMGLLCPELSAKTATIEFFESWLGEMGTLEAKVFVHPNVAARARTEDLGLPQLPSELLGAATPRFADGLDWLLRLCLVWQQVEESPVRLTQTNTLFKRDLGRFQTDEVLTTAAPDELRPLTDFGVLSLFWAQASGLLNYNDGELHAAPFPPTWNTALLPTLIDLWAGLTAVEHWDPLKGYAPSDTGLSPAPTAGMLALLLLARAPINAWTDPQPIADWLWEHHPSWQGSLPRDDTKLRGRGWVESYMLGVAYPLKLVEAALHEGEWKLRLTDVGRHLLCNGPEPVPAPSFPQALLVQPNAEVLAYRQGLTPGLIGKLSRFAKWKNLGPACTLELNAARTYHGLESGMTLAGILQTLNQHSMKPVPATVADLLRRWADKRDRITVFSSATLVEFQTPADLDAAISRGMVSIRVTERIGLTDDGRDPEFKYLRLIGNRDYEAKPQQCVSIAQDGVTLTLDAAQSDLLLEAEIIRIADTITGDPPSVRRFLLTPSSLKRAASFGFSLNDLDTWFHTRAGEPLPAAARLFVMGPIVTSPTFARHLVVRLPSKEIADGVMQWPATSTLLGERLGPNAVVIDEANVPQLRDVLAELGIVLEEKTEND